MSFKRSESIYEVLSSIFSLYCKYAVEYSETIKNNSQRVGILRLVKQTRQIFWVVTCQLISL